MNRLSSAALALMLAIPASSLASTWEIDPSHSTIGFSIRHMMVSNVRGEFDILTEVAPSRIADREFRDWFARAGRQGASPSTAPRIWESVLRAAPRDALLEQLVVPTLVLHRRDNLFAPDDVLTVARERVPHATLVELEGSDHFPFVGDVDALVAEIGAFVVGERRLPPPQRLLAAVLFTDLVGSTERAAALGDESWKSVISRPKGSRCASACTSATSIVAGMTFRGSRSTSRAG